MILLLAITQALLGIGLLFTGLTLRLQQKRLDKLERGMEEALKLVNETAKLATAVAERQQGTRTYHA